MKLFLDTNVFVEFIEHRKQYEPVSQRRMLLLVYTLWKSGEEYDETRGF